MFIPGFRRGQSVQVVSTNSDDLVVKNSGIHFDGEHLDYLWFELEEQEAGKSYHVYKAIKLRVLTHIPIEARDDPAILGKMVTVLRGLYNAGVDFMHLHAGIFERPALGIIQVYGVIGVSEKNLYDALGKAELGMTAMQAAMANYPQSKLAPLNTRQSQWLLDALQTMPHALSVVGQPDPREEARGGGRKGPQMTGQPAPMQGEITAQQNEMFMRGMARVREEYVMITLASRVERGDLAIMLEGLSREASIHASKQRGARAISFGFALPVALGAGSGRSSGRGYSEGENEGVSSSTSVSEGTSRTEGTTHTEGTSWGDSYSRSIGEADSVGHTRTVTNGVTEGTTHTISTSEGVSESKGTAVSDGTNWGVSDTQGRAVSESTSWAVSDSVGHSQSHTVTDGHGSSHSVSMGNSTSQGTANSLGVGVNAGVSGNLSASPGGVGIGVGSNFGTSLNASHTESQGVGTSFAVVDANSSMHSESVSTGTTTAHTESYGGSHGVTVSTAHGVSSGGSHGVTQSVGTGTSKAVSESIGHSRSTSHSVSDADSQSHTRSWGESWGTTRGGNVSDSKSVSDGVSHTESSSQGVSSGTSIARAQTYGVSNMVNASIGGVPSVSFSKTYQWEDDVEIRLTMLLRQQEELLNEMSMEGGYLTDVYVLTRTQNGKRAAEALVPQAFHGMDEVVTPVLTRDLTSEEEEHLRLHASCFTPCAAEEMVPGVMSGYRHSSLLTMLQVAAYTAPGIFEEGVALTTQESIPPFAFLPDMDGDVVLGHLISTETGDLTDAQVRLSQERMFHTIFAGNTGYGKSVAAERLALETTARWKYRTIVLDFGQGWRKMLNAPGLQGHVEIYQLQPGAMRPLRWNPLQFGKRIDPEQQLRAICDLFANAGGMGPRQLGFMRRALIDLYLEHGALTADRQVLANAAWNLVRDANEEDAIARRMQELSLPPRNLVGVHLSALTAVERQALACHRSREVDIPGWYERLDKMHKALPEKSITDRTSLEGVLLRLEPFSRGEVALMYGKVKGDNVMTIEDVSMPWGMTIFEGGAELDEFSKVALLSMMAWHLYTDAVRRRREELNQGGFKNWMQIYFEEANKVLSGVGQTVGSESDSGGGASTAQQFQDMWRDGRKYRVWMHLITQSPSTLPPGIVDSCNNAFIVQLKNPKDRDLMMAHLALSEKGFVDEHYKRFISRMEVAKSIIKLGYSMERGDVQPMLAEALMVPAREPTDAEIYRAFLS